MASSFSSSPVPRLAAAASVGAFLFVGAFWLVRERPSSEQPPRQEEIATPRNAAPHSRKPFGPSHSGDWTTRPLSEKDLPRLSTLSMNPELARHLLERAKTEVKGFGARAEISAAILASLCDQGHSAAAWDLLETNPGIVRQSQITALFSREPGSARELPGKLAALSDPKERSLALKAWITSKPRETASMDFSAVPLDSNQEKRSVAEAILAAMSKTRNHPDQADVSRALLEKSASLVKEGKLEAEHLRSIINSDSTNDPFQHWSVLDQLRDSVTPEEMERLRTTAVGRMVIADVERSLDLICSDASTSPVIERAIHQLYTSDSRRANEWVISRLPDLGPETGQHVIAGVARFAIRTGELETARTWIGQLEDDAIRRTLLDQIPETPGSP